MADTPLQLQIRFFAVLREQAGCSTLKLATTARTSAELYAELQKSHALTFPANLLRVAVNERYGEMHTPLTTGDRIVFIPPVAGG
ncbi:MAG: molybdopterin converting factor subunit 1 [Lacunisphaera sp.]|nr:molybdopterin converting factor subunit 1 [Lacunisphaera sp.]